MVLVRDHPAPALLAQAHRQAQPLLRPSLEALGSSAAREGVGERDVRPGSDVELDKVEAPALPLPVEEGRPGLAIGVDSAYAILGWWDVEHHDVCGVVGEDRVQVPG